jgi:hypothetical protein
MLRVFDSYHRALAFHALSAVNPTRGFGNRHAEQLWALSTSTETLANRRVKDCRHRRDVFPRYVHGRHHTKEMGPRGINEQCVRARPLHDCLRARHPQIECPQQTTPTNASELMTVRNLAAVAK